MIIKAETKVCQSCKSEFFIESEDFAFYEKFGVLPPRMCVLCRAQRRLAFRNERSLYKRTCDRCKKDMVSMYSPNKPYTVWCHDCWFSDDWDPLEYGKRYDLSRPFFDQFEEVWKAVPKVGLIHVRSVNSEYVNIAADNKNCYMIVESSNNEDCSHCYWIQVCRDSVDISFSHQTELSYESDDCYNSYKLLYSKGCHDSKESYFLLDCRNCSHCIGCVNVRNKDYHIFNKPVTKAEYEEFLQGAKLDTASGVEALREKFEAFISSQPRRYAEVINAPNSSGNYISDAKNCKTCFHAYDAEDCKYSVHVWRGSKDNMDCDTAGRGSVGNYNCTNAGLNVYRQTCATLCWESTFTEYSMYCQTSNNIFGSVGLRKKDYCILNKQYTKEEYERLKERIVHQMTEAGEYGEYFPPALSAFGYNEACGQEQFPLTKEEALAQGFKWEDHPRGTYGKETISWGKVPDSINDLAQLDPSKEIFVCTACEKNYRIIPSELTFYKRLSIPLPRLCPDCRHIRRFTSRGPNRLWERTCKCGGGASDDGVYTNTAAHPHASQSCSNTIETSYAPDRPELVYCEQCYNAEVA